MTIQERGRQTQAKVLEAALSLFAAQGSQVRIEDIRDASGVSVGSIYHHFENRDNIVVAIYAESLAQLLEAIAKNVTACTSARDGIVAFVTTYLGWLDNNRDRARVIFSIRQFRVDDQAIAESGEAKLVALMQIASWYADYAANGEVRPIDPRMLEVMLVGPLAEYWQRKDSGLLVEIDDQDVRQLLSDAAWRVVRP